MKRLERGFTLVELLVVIAIITVLAAIIVPAVNRSMQQARRQQTLAEMQNLASIITQVYHEVGYYVRLEDLVRRDEARVRRWANTAAGHDYLDGRSEGELAVDLSDSANGNRNVSAFWSGPYTTYQHFVDVDPADPGPESDAGVRPLDPWGRGEEHDVARFHQYRMFWSTAVAPAGASGSMVIISPGPDGRYQSGIDSRAHLAGEAEFQNFDPNAPSGDDIFFAFNAGIQILP